MRRVVVVGSGSAGRRHARALQLVDPTIEVTMVRRPGSTQPLEPLRELGVEIVDSLDGVLDATPTAAVIASPAPMHLDPTTRLLDAGTTVLVEKPLAADLASARSLAAAASIDERNLLVGYHLRFGDTVPELRRLIEAGCIGTPTGFRFEVGQHLSAWRPSVDPRGSVSARQELGGGVLLELSHELDGLRFVLDTEVSEVTSARLQTGGAPTDGVVETVADLELVTAEGIRGTVHLDMTSDPPVRRWQIEGSIATLTADLLTGSITMASSGTAPQVVSSFPPNERDRCEERLIRHLLAVADGAEQPRCTALDGVAAVAIVDAARRCADTGLPAEIEALQGDVR